MSTLEQEAMEAATLAVRKILAQSKDPRTSMSRYSPASVAFHAARAAIRAHEAYLDARMAWKRAEEAVAMNEDEKNEMTGGSELVIRAKWSIDGATSLEDAAVKAGGFAAYLRGLAAEGYELTGPVDDDYGFARKGEQS